MATTLIFIRHGESEANYEHRFTGQSNVFGLTERGHAQAQAAAEALNGICVDAIIASDLRRAYDTAKHVGDLRGMEVIPDEGFREIFAGKWEGERFDDLPHCIQKISVSGSPTSVRQSVPMGKRLPICKSASVRRWNRLYADIPAKRSSSEHTQRRSVSCSASGRTCRCRV